MSEIRRCEPDGGSAWFDEDANGRCSVRYVMVKRVVVYSYRDLCANQLTNLSTFVISLNTKRFIRAELSPCHLGTGHTGCMMIKAILAYPSRVYF